MLSEFFESMACDFIITCLNLDRNLALTENTMFLYKGKWQLD